MSRQDLSTPLRTVVLSCAKQLDIAPPDLVIHVGPQFFCLQTAVPKRKHGRTGPEHKGAYQRRFTSSAEGSGWGPQQAMRHNHNDPDMTPQGCSTQSSKDTNLTSTGLVRFKLFWFQQEKGQGRADSMLKSFVCPRQTDMRMNKIRVTCRSFLVLGCSMWNSITDLNCPLSTESAALFASSVEKTKI